MSDFWKDIGDSFDRASDNNTPLLKAKAKVSDRQIIETAAAAGYQISDDGIHQLAKIPLKTFENIITHIGRQYPDLLVINMKIVTDTVGELSQLYE